MTPQRLLPSLLPSGKVKPGRPKGFFRDSRKTDQTAVVLDYARPSKLSIDVAWKSWTRFCEEELPEDEDDKHDPVAEADRVDREVDVPTVRAFLGWLLANGNFRQLDAHIHSHLKEEHELSEISQFRATMNNDDAICTDYYPTERQRLQHALLILLCAGTSARPGTLIEGGGYYDENDALRYGDIKTHVVRNPEDPARKSVVMLITLRLMKGYRNRGAPPTFVFYERPETPSFCVVSHILGLAFDDDAFLSPFITSPEDIWRIDVPSHRQGTPIEWKSSVEGKGASPSMRPNVNRRRDVSHQSRAVYYHEQV
ncbi:hypothetical protein MMC13_007426 [Lambiella insularis]|nr:hypothetical protein [Lambiella insularis]